MNDLIKIIKATILILVCINIISYFFLAIQFLNEISRLKLENRKFIYKDDQSIIFYDVFSHHFDFDGYTYLVFFFDRNTKNQEEIIWINSIKNLKFNVKSNDEGICIFSNYKNLNINTNRNIEVDESC